MLRMLTFAHKGTLAARTHTRSGQGSRGSSNQFHSQASCQAAMLDENDYDVSGHAANERSLGRR